MTGAHGHPRERGVILIAVLLTVAIMAVMVVAAAALTRAGIGNEELEQRRLASHLALRSGIESAKALILSTPPDQRLTLDGEDVPVDLGNGVSATVTLRDAAGFVDLNRSDPKLIEAVARFTGLGKPYINGLADKITKLRKEAAPDSAAAKPATPASQQGVVAVGSTAAANATTPPGKEPPPPPMVFLSVDQLRSLLALPLEEGKALESGLTVFNPTGEINPLAAPEQVLQSIPGLSETDISAIAMVKKAGTAGKDARVQQLAQRLPGVVTVKEPRVFMIEVTLDGGPGVLKGSAARAVVRVLPEGPMPFGTLALEEE